MRVTHPNLRLQIQQKQQAENKPPTHLIMFVVRDDDGIKPLAGHGFSYTAREYQAGLKVDEGMTAAGGKTVGAAK